MRNCHETTSKISCISRFMRACDIFYREREKQPAHPAYPALKVKNLTCGIGGIGGIFLAYDK